MYISLMRSSVSGPTPKAQETCGKGKTGKVCCKRLLLDMTRTLYLSICCCCKYYTSLVQDWGSLKFHHERAMAHGAPSFPQGQLIVNITGGRVLLSSLARPLISCPCPVNNLLSILLKATQLNPMRHAHTDKYTDAYIHTQKFTHMHRHTDIQIHTHTCIHTQTHIDTHRHTSMVESRRGTCWEEGFSGTGSGNDIIGNR